MTSFLSSMGPVTPLQAPSDCKKPLEEEGGWPLFEETFKELGYPLKSVYEGIHQCQGDLKNGETEELEASPKFPYSILIRKRKYFVLTEQVGEGTFSEVYKAAYFSACSNVSRWGAIKRTKNGRLSESFSPQKHKLRLATGNLSKGIDMFEETFQSKKGVFYSLHEFYEKDLSSIDYMILNKPVCFLIEGLLGAIKGLCSLHAHDFIHRDVKGGNVLVTGKKRGGVMTDFGTLTPEKLKRHFTTGTAHYLNPKMFGSPGESLNNQKKRFGRQTKAGDLFAFGRMIERDGLMIILSQLAKKFEKQDIIEPILNQLKPEQKNGPFSPEYLRRCGRDYSNRAIYIHGGRYGDKEISERIMIFKENSARLKILNQAIALLKDSLSEEQISNLSKLAKLAKTLQDDGDQDLSADGIKDQLRSLSPSPEEAAFSPQRKRTKVLKENDRMAPTQLLSSPSKKRKASSAVSQQRKRTKILKENNEIAATQLLSSPPKKRPQTSSAVLPQCKRTKILKENNEIAPTELLSPSPKKRPSKNLFR